MSSSYFTFLNFKKNIRINIFITIQYFKHFYLVTPKGHATRNDIVDDIVDFSSSTMGFNVAKIASARASLTISLTKSLRVAGPLIFAFLVLSVHIPLIVLHI